MNPPDPLEDALAAGPAVERERYEHALDRARAAAAGAGVVDVAWATVASPVGELVVAATEAGVVLVSWDLEPALERLAVRISPRVLHAGRRLDPVRRQLDEYFAGRRRRFDVPIDWTLTAGFRREVLHQLVQVPFGQVVTYGELADRVGNPGAARAVGSAMATNPIPVIVPCHRVLPRSGGLGSYSGRNGVVTKQFLLDLEGAPSPRRGATGQDGGTGR